MFEVPNLVTDNGKNLLVGHCIHQTRIYANTAVATGKGIDLIGLVNKVDEALKDCEKPITVAVMGCVVNGPGEAREADIGIAGGVGEALLFKKGEIVCKIPEDKIIDTLLSEIEKMRT